MFYNLGTVLRPLVPCGGGNRVGTGESGEAYREVWGLLPLMCCVSWAQLGGGEVDCAGGHPALGLWGNHAGTGALVAVVAFAGLGEW